MNDKNIKVYQIYHNNNLTLKLDSAFIPYDHSVFTEQNPELSWKMHEWPVIRDFGFKRAIEDKADIWGFVSYKFNIKTGTRGQDFIDFIKNNPDNHVWFMEPYYPNNDYFNPWTQGDIYHSNISDVANYAFRKLGFDIDVRRIHMPFCWYNYFVGTKEFWNTFFTITNEIEKMCETDEYLNDYLFYKQASPHYPGIPYFIFFVERLISLIFVTFNLKSKGFRYEYI
jgi:hypothetical protein